MKSKTPKTKPLFVAISDVHYSLSTLDLADKAFRAAINKAAELGVPLIDCGDLTNDKAILRGEVVNRLIETMKYANSKDVTVYCLVGNHSLVNEKGSEHVLNFLDPYAIVIDEVCASVELPKVTFIPYQNDTNQLLAILKSVNKGRMIVMHQGFNGANMGDYMIDKTSIDPGIVKDFKVFSGHYHRHQTIGTVTYIGNPYTLSFGEADDGAKGFLVVNEDGTFTREVLKLRKHIIWSLKIGADPNFYAAISSEYPLDKIVAGDLIWVKLKGASMELAKITKQGISNLIGHMNFKLDKLPTDEVRLDKTKECRTDEQVMDALIDSGGDTPDQKLQLKKLWRELL